MSVIPLWRARGVLPEPLPIGVKSRAAPDHSPIHHIFFVGDVPETGFWVAGTVDPFFMFSVNVWQWCEDWYDNEQKYRVLRGASWLSTDPGHLLSSYRYMTASAAVAISPVISDHQNRTFLNEHALFAWQLLAICLNAAVNNDKVNHKEQIQIWLKLRPRLHPKPRPNP